jgi:hypothetical protein
MMNIPQVQHLPPSTRLMILKEYYGFESTEVSYHSHTDIYGSMKLPLLYTISLNLTLSESLLITISLPF